MASTETSLRTSAAGAAAATEPLFDAERLEVYQVALAFQRLVPGFIPRRGCAALRDQLDRASASIALNIAEGCGRWARPDKAHFASIGLRLTGDIR
jgi:hypothetical protein